jgi:transposase
MLGDRKSPKMKQQILELHGRGIGKRNIAQMLGLSKNTVKGVIRAAGGEALELPVTATQAWAQQVPWDEVRAELGKRYVTIACLHREYAPEGVAYLRFWRELQRRIPSGVEDRVRIRFQYKPGQRLEIDYCDGIPITDRETGSRRATHLFAAVSAFSDYTYGEFVMSQKRDEFIASQERTHHFFGGIFDYVVIDNLKSGVHQAHIYDPDVNPVYVDYSNHMGFAVLPARPCTPRDKPAIETAVGVIQRQFFAEMRNRTFYSLAELNFAFREYLKRLNSAPMKDYGVSRAERFEEERSVLKPLPASLFEVSEYRSAKVHPDCHVQVDRNFYSVPFPLIGQTLRVRLTSRLIEIFNEDHQGIAVHTRLRGRGLFSTNDAHYPEQKLAAVRFDVLLAKREAEKVGPKTAALVESLLDGGRPLRFLRRVQGILRLRKSQTAMAIEYACAQALLFQRPRLAYVSDCAKRFDLAGLRPRVIGTPERDLSSIYLKPIVPEPEETSSYE